MNRDETKNFSERLDRLRFVINFQGGLVREKNEFNDGVYIGLIKARNIMLGQKEI